jgi:DNA polymerase III delta prime subunit
MVYSRQLKFLDLIIKNGKVPHAFLFYGHDRLYKSNLAKSCVFRINSPESDWQDFELKNDLAEKIKKESHPDLLVVRRFEDKKEIAISQIRALRDFVSKTPIDLNFKAVIIEEAEFLNEESWNAILKTLEEPSPNTVIFILSAGTSGIPKTVLSRVLSMPFYSADNLERQSGIKNDIILSKLASVNGMSVAEKFDLAEEIASAENTAAILDDWLLDLRSNILKNPNKNLSESIEKVMNAKSILVSTNANAKLILENLMLQING